MHRQVTEGPWGECPACQSVTTFQVVVTSISINSGGALVRLPARNTLEKTGVKGRSSRTSGMVFDTPRGIKLKSNLTSSVGNSEEKRKQQATGVLGSACGESAEGQVWVREARVRCGVQSRRRRGRGPVSSEQAAGSTNSPTALRGAQSRASNP